MRYREQRKQARINQLTIKRKIMVNEKWYNRQK
jgi:hypothetical protein